LNRHPDWGVLKWEQTGMGCGFCENRNPTEQKTEHLTLKQIQSRLGRPLGFSETARSLAPPHPRRPKVAAAGAAGTL